MNYLFNKSTVNKLTNKDNSAVASGSGSGGGGSGGGGQVFYLTDNSIATTTQYSTLSSWSINTTLSYVNNTNWSNAQLTSNDYFSYDGETGKFTCLQDCKLKIQALYQYIFANAIDMMTRSSNASNIWCSIQHYNSSDVIQSSKMLYNHAQSSTTHTKYNDYVLSFSTGDYLKVGFKTQSGSANLQLYNPLYTETTGFLANYQKQPQGFIQFQVVS